MSTILYVGGIVGIIGGIIGLVCIFANWSKLEHRNVLMAVPISVFLIAGMLMYNAHRITERDKKIVQEYIRLQQAELQKAAEEEKDTFVQDAKDLATMKRFQKMYGSDIFSNKSTMARVERDLLEQYQAAVEYGDSKKAEKVYDLYTDLQNATKIYRKKAHLVKEPEPEFKPEWTQTWTRRQNRGRRAMTREEFTPEQATAPAASGAEGSAIPTTAPPSMKPSTSSVAEPTVSSEPVANPAPTGKLDSVKTKPSVSYIHRQPRKTRPAPIKKTPPVPKNVHDANSKMTPYPGS